MILGQIGARKGSKGVPRKNFRNLHGRPLIDWSLDQLKRNPRIDAIVVSTDDPQIYEYGLLQGALDIGLRPGELATDAAPKWGVWQHALAASEAVLGQSVDVFVDLDCTSPLRLDADLDGALDLFAAQKPDMVMSVCESRKNPYFNMLELDETGSLQVSKPLPGGVWARQAAPKVWDHAGGTYILRAGYLREASTLYDGRVIPFEMPPERCLDVDSLFDWDVVEFLKGRQLGL